MKKKVLSILLIIYIGIAIFFPVDQYNIKIFVLALACFISLKDILRLKNEIDIITFLISIVFPIITIIISCFSHNDLITIIRAGYVPFLFLWLPIIIYNNLDLKKYFFFFLKLEAILISVLALLDIIGIIDVNTGVIRKFIYDWEIGYMGKSHNYAAYYKIFLKTSPLLVFLLDKFFEEKKYPMMLVTCFALIISGTRANIIVMVIYLLWRIVHLLKKNNLFKFVLAFIIISLIIINIPNIYDVFIGMMNTSGSISSDNVRKGQLRSYIEIFSEPTNLLLGTGLGAEFYNYGRSRWVKSAEYAYFDLMRQIGLIMFMLFMVFVLYPLKKKMSIHKKIIYIGYLAIAFTNPLLFSSTAFLAYTYIYYSAYEKDTKKENLTEMREPSI